LKNEISNSEFILKVSVCDLRFAVMILTSIRLVFKYFFQNITRNVWLSFVAVTIMVASQLSLTSMFIMNGIAVSMVNNVSEKVDISLYFPAAFSLERAEEYRREIERFPETKRVTLISPKEALGQFTAKHSDDELIISSLKELDGNPIGPIITIQANTLEDYPAIIDTLDKLSISKAAEELDYKNHETTIESLKSIMSKVRFSGLVLSVFFAFIACLTVINTVRLGIYSHRDEIAIMKLVGATNGFIRAPYLLEGIVYAILSTGVTWGILAAVAHGLSVRLNEFFGSTGFSISSFIATQGPQLILGEAILLALLNVLATSLALRKYMHV